MTLRRKGPRIGSSNGKTKTNNMNERKYDATRPLWANANGDFICPLPLGEHSITFLGFTIRFRNKDKIFKDPEAKKLYEYERGELDRIVALAEKGNDAAINCLWAAPWYRYESEGQRTDFIHLVKGLQSPEQGQVYNVDCAMVKVDEVDRPRLTFVGVSDAIPPTGDEAEDAEKAKLATTTEQK